MPLRWRLRHLAMRIMFLSALAGGIVALPDLDPDSILRYKNAVVAFLFVIGLGKLLFDTFFFDHYVP